MAERQAVEPQPDPGPVTVSVVVPVWNVAPWLGECLASVEAQTIGIASVELITVDDGSTDGSGDMLDAFAASRPWVTVVHQANSGGPGGPRNVGLDRARGRYVFFLDADDYLGPEALARLVAMAERNTSDIVLGRMVGVSGRASSGRTGVFGRNRDRVRPELVFRSGNALKLFRRSFLDGAGLRFQRGVAGGEDGDFMARAYLAARVISIVADYPCYYARRRPGSQTSRSDRRDDLVAYLERLETNRVAVAVAGRRPGPRRNMLLAKPLGKMANKFWHAWTRRDAEERHRVFEAGAAMARRWHGPGVDHWMTHRQRLALHCLGQGKEAELLAITTAPRRRVYGHPVVEGRTVYAAFPHFRDGSGIPDRCFEITREIPHRVALRRATLAGGRLELVGHAYLRLLGGTTRIELRRWPMGRRLRYPTDVTGTPELRDRAGLYPRAGFHASLDVTGLGPGTWTVRAVTETGAVHRTSSLRLRLHHGREPLDSAPEREGRVTLRLGPRRGLRLTVGREIRGPQRRLILAADAILTELSCRGRRASRVAQLLVLGRVG
jgi:glycosyltransferase involved in cell wall biosynthesis